MRRLRTAPPRRRQAPSRGSNPAGRSLGFRQRRALAQQTRQEVEAVCSDSTLSIGQKRREIQQIHQRERQELGAIITLAQQEAMRSCLESRNDGRTGGGHAGASSGPCGEMPSGQKPAPQPEEDASPNGAAKPN